MQDADLFMELAAIAGVFVGFGALIAVRSGGASDPFEVAWMRGVVSMGLLTIVAALAPVVISRYAVTDHVVWALSSILVLVGSVGLWPALGMTPEARLADEPTRRSVTIARAAVWLPTMGVAYLAPIVILLGIAPDLEEVLYFTVVALILLWCAIPLMMLVFTGRRPATAPGDTAAPG